MILCTRCEALNTSAGRCPACGHDAGAATTPPSPPPCLEAGAAVGPWRVESLLKEHGRRRVYLARDEAGRTVILKEHSLEGEGDRGRRHLVVQHERERDVLDRLHHPAIPRLFGALQSGERLYLALQWMGGAPLRRVWRGRSRRRFPEAEAYAIAGDLAEALAYIHGGAPPVFHRDLSAGNVLYDPGARPVVALIDFGTAVSPGDESVRMYTRGFDPPERHFQPTDGAPADVYGLGALLHFLLSGRDPAADPPFQHPPLRAVSRDVSAHAETLCLWMLQPDPGRRPDSQEALRALRGGPLPSNLDPRVLARAAREAEGDTLRLLERHAGARRDPRRAMDLAGRLLSRGQERAARRVLLDGLETLRSEREDWDPRVAGPLYAGLAEQYLFAEDAPRALALCAEAGQHAPGEAAVELLTARGLVLAGRGEEARARLETALAGEESPDLLTALAERLVAEGRPAEAEPLARRALDLDPRGFEAARILDRAAVHPSRLAQLEARAADRPGDIGARVDLGVALLAAGRKSEGDEVLTAAARAAREGASVPAGQDRRLYRWLLRQLAEDQGVLEEALQVADEAARRHPGSPFFIYYGGLVARLLGRHEDALERFTRLLGLGDGALPDGEADENVAGARAVFWLGRSLEDLARLDEARACYERAVARAPGYKAALDRLRRVEGHGGRD